MTRIAEPVALKNIPSLKKLTPGQRISRVMTMLQHLTREQATEELFSDVCALAMEIPTNLRPEALSSTIAQAFGKTPEQVDLVLKQIDRKVDFDTLVPESGFIHDYIEWTRQTEPPTVFHFFTAATVLGATLGRSIFFDKGAYQVFPNLAIMIVAPTGRCRKTSCCNLGVGLLQKNGTTILADKATPEAFVDALKDQQNATGLIYAPELAVFLGKQKYQEGMIPLLTSLLDCPKEWTSKTIGRGETSLTNVALSALMCSTIDWLKTNIPPEAFGGGFMSRFLFVSQESTPRSFPLPPPMNADIKKRILSTLMRVKLKRGPFKMTADAEAWYRHWYELRPSLQGDKQFAGYFERKPDHIIRLAMVMAIASRMDERELLLTDIDLIHADKILAWLEGFLPATFDEMTSSVSGEDQARILKHLKMAGGTVEHSVLLRKNSSRMNAEQFKRAITTLREAKLVEWNATDRTYVLTPEGWG